jgi:hypothetical protein
MYLGVWKICVLGPGVLIDLTRPGRNDWYSSLNRFWPLTSVAEPSMRTIEWRKREGQLNLPLSLPFLPVTSLPTLSANFWWLALWFQFTYFRGQKTLTSRVIPILVKGLDCLFPAWLAADFTICWRHYLYSLRARISATRCDVAAHWHDLGLCPWRNICFQHIRSLLYSVARQTDNVCLFVREWGCICASQAASVRGTTGISSSIFLATQTFESELVMWGGKFSIENFPQYFSRKFSVS